MTTFHPIILECPKCSALMSAYELMSYTTHRSENYSDGKTELGMPASKDISICTACRLPFWREDGRLPGDPDWEEHGDLGSVMDLHDLEWNFDDDRDEKTIAFYKDLLDDGFADTDEREIFLRVRIWWSVNDLVRHLSTWRSARNLRMLRAIIKHRRETLSLFETYRELFDQNLEQLIFLYIKSDDVDLLYLANMYRESGNFSKAREILDKVERKSGAWRKVKRGVGKRDRLVCNI